MDGWMEDVVCMYVWKCGCVHTSIDDCLYVCPILFPPSQQQVETLFHEFGHGAQHMLTEVTHGDAAGINGGWGWPFVCTCMPFFI